MLKGFTPRLYQETIFSTCVLNNTLVVLPTGLGKTNILLMLAIKRLKSYPKSKILILGPTKPLISQYQKVFLEHINLPAEEMVMFTGTVSPEKRKELWKTAKIVFSTPQTIENDIISNRIDLKEVSLLGIDEAHRAVKEYSYVWISKRYYNQARYPKIIGLTASPGGNKESIDEVIKNLFIESIEVRNYDDPDVKPYVKETKLEWIEIELPEKILKIKTYLEASFKEKLTLIKDMGFIKSKDLNRKELLDLQAFLVKEMNLGNKDFNILKSLSLNAEAMKISHAIELIGSQSISALHSYLQKIIEQSLTTKVKAIKNLARDPDFKSAAILTQRLFEEGIEHPKINKLKELIPKKGKVIVFTQFRDTAKVISEELNKEKGIKAKIFVGQQKKNGTGLTQKEQIAMIESFRNEEFNVIVMTSVGEEGLDIPKVDEVIFYEPVPSAIRHIQRRGRTGRQEKGIVKVLIAKKTRDEAYRWSAKHKEKRMYSILENMRNKNIEIKKQETLDKFNNKINENIKIIIDHREKGSQVIKNLIEKEVKIELEQLEVGDFVLSSKVVIEYKTNFDFINSIIDGRLLSQLRSLKDNYMRPIVIVEGELDIYNIRNIHPNAIRGMLATISASYGIPLIQTKNSKDTAELIYIIAKREQEDGKTNFTPHTEKKSLSIKEQQEYIVSSFPGIGPLIGKELLKEFKTIKNIINSEEKDLQNIKKVGKITADRLSKIFSKEYF